MEVCIQLFVDTLDGLIVTRCSFNWTCGLELHTVTILQKRHQSRRTHLTLTEGFAANGLMFENILELVFSNEGVAKERRGMDGNRKRECEASLGTGAVHFFCKNDTYILVIHYNRHVTSI